MAISFYSGWIKVVEDSATVTIELWMLFHLLLLNITIRMDWYGSWNFNSSNSSS